MASPKVGSSTIKIVQKDFAYEYFDPRFIRNQLPAGCKLLASKSEKCHFQSSWLPKSSFVCLWLAVKIECKQNISTGVDTVNLTDGHWTNTSAFQNGRTLLLALQSGAVSVLARYSQQTMDIG